MLEYFTSSYANAALASALYTFLWIGFFALYTPKKTIRSRFLLVAFFLGINAALLARVIEESILVALPFDTSFISPLYTPENLQSLLAPLIFSFLFAAVVEEASKFGFVERLFGALSINQVIDGMKIGLFLGLGFAFVENIIYFERILNVSVGNIREIISVFVLRGVFSTLAHGIYGIFMGYYLSLAKFHQEARRRFLFRALIAAVAVHGFFNFFIIVNLGFYSVFMLVVLLATALLWYRDRHNLELRLTAKNRTLVVPPFLAERLELDVWTSRHPSEREYLERLWSILLEEEDKK